MTPQERDLLIRTAQRLDRFLDEYYRSNFPDKMILQKELVVNNKVTIGGNLKLKDGSTVSTGAGTGVKFGDTGDKIGFLGKSPVGQQATVTAPAGGGGATTDAIDISARTAINQIKAYLTAFGFTL
jgi:hypothetical protein